MSLLKIFYRVVEFRRETAQHCQIINVQNLPKLSEFIAWGLFSVPSSKFQLGHVYFWRFKPLWQFLNLWEVFMLVRERGRKKMIIFGCWKMERSESMKARSLVYWKSSSKEKKKGATRFDDQEALATFVRSISMRSGR